MKALIKVALGTVAVISVVKAYTAYKQYAEAKAITAQLVAEGKEIEQAAADQEAAHQETLKGIREKGEAVRKRAADSIEEQEKGPTMLSELQDVIGSVRDNLGYATKGSATDLPEKGVLVTVFEDGKVLNDRTLDDIRADVVIGLDSIEKRTESHHHVTEGVQWHRSVKEGELFFLSGDPNFAIAMIAEKYPDDVQHLLPCLGGYKRLLD